jgi:hypothetical protein
MDHYDIPVFESPYASFYTVNYFFQAKYGMFTCIDSETRPGLIKYDPGLISYWERNPE